MTWLVVGLGNPGPTYAATRHNVGWFVTDELARRLGGKFALHKGTRAELLQGRIGAEKVVLGRSRGYMNESGGPVRALMNYFSVEPENLVVIHDELDLPVGSLRAKTGGGDNGHNGLRSIRQVLGTGDFHRIRVGIGRPPGRQPVQDFVLKPFVAADRTEIDIVVQEAADAVETLVEHGLERTQNLFNS